MTLYEHEHLGGDGPSVACYLRVSTIRQAKEGFSIEAQREILRRMVGQHHASEVYWFADEGKTGVDFDKRKVGDILRLKEEGKISQLWVTDVDRIGRDTRQLLLFFLQFCFEGGKICTPDKMYDSRDLVDLFVFIMKANSAEESNKSRARACKAGKAQSFLQKHWNKPVPLGYSRKGKWLEKEIRWEEVIQALFTSFLDLKNYVKVAKSLIDRYGAQFNIKFDRHKIYSIINDTTYIGRPQHLGVTVEDPSLAFIDQELFNNCQEIKSVIFKEHHAHPSGPIEHMAVSKPISLLIFLQHHVQFTHIGCGGAVTKNGTTEYNGVAQQWFLCKQCKGEWRIPTFSQLDAERSPLIHQYDSPRPSPTERIKNKSKEVSNNTSLDNWFSSLNRSSIFDLSDEDSPHNSDRELSDKGKG